MSRHVEIRNNLEIVYGFDHMTPEGGYFFQVFDSNKIDEDKNEEGLVLNRGFVFGISKTEMFELMTEYNISNKEHIKNVALDLQI